MSTSIPREGLLTEIGFCELLAWLCRDRITGTLRLCHGAKEKAIFLKEGNIIFAASKDPDERLGTLLLNRGVITRAQLDEASNQVTTGKRLGAILVGLGYLPVEDLPRWVVTQVKEILFSLFAWTEGSFRFEKGPLPAREVITLKISTLEVFLIGARRVTRWSILKRDPADAQIVFQLSSEAEKILGNVELGDEERALLDMAKQSPMSLEALVKQASLPVLTAYQILFAFRVLGVLVPAKRPDTDAGVTEPEVGTAASVLPLPKPEEVAGLGISSAFEASDTGMTKRFSVPLADVERDDDSSADGNHPMVSKTEEEALPIPARNQTEPEAQDQAPTESEVEISVLGQESALGEENVPSSPPDPMVNGGTPLTLKGNPLEAGPDREIRRPGVGAQTIIMANPEAGPKPAPAGNPVTQAPAGSSPGMAGAAPAEAPVAEPVGEEPIVVVMESTLETSSPTPQETGEGPMRGDGLLGAEAVHEVPQPPKELHLINEEPSLDSSSESQANSPTIPNSGAGMPREEEKGPSKGSASKPSSRKKTEYHVVCVEGRMLKRTKTKQIEQLLGQWSQRGFHLAGVVQGRSTGLFESAPPSFFIFARD